MTQATRLLEARRRIANTTIYKTYLEQTRQRKQAFLQKMIGGLEQPTTGPKRLSEILGENSPTNAMGLSSVVRGQGAISLQDLPLLPTRRRRKRLRELVGSTMNDLGLPHNPIMTPGPRKKRPTKKTSVIFNPQLKA